MSTIRYEKETVEKMIHLYCRKKHKTKSEHLCPDCEAIRNYALERLDKCPFGDEKSSCNRCKVHCYKPEMRQRIREIMRFSGPRMLIYYPFDFVKHYVRKQIE